MSYGSGANSSVNPEEEIAREGANPLEEPLLTIEWVESTLESGRRKFDRDRVQPHGAGLLSRSG